MPNDAASTPPAPTKRRLLVADDHPVVRAGLLNMLSHASDVTVVCESADGLDAVEQWHTHRPDAGLIDLRMPGLDGIEVIGRIRERDPSARLIVMTTLCGDEDVYRALQAGASGYLLKDCDAPRLIECVQAVLRGQRYLDAAAAASLASRVVRVPLTPRELDVLRYISLGLSNKRIARQLDVAEGTIKTHVKSLLDKLDCDNRTAAIRVAVSRGLVRAPAAVV